MPWRELSSRRRTSLTFNPPRIYLFEPMSCTAREQGCVAVAAMGCDVGDPAALLAAAELALERAHNAFESAMGPAWHSAIALADLRVRQARLGEAEALLLGLRQRRGAHWLRAESTAAIALLEPVVDRLDPARAPWLRALLLLELARQHEHAGDRATAQVEAR